MRGRRRRRQICDCGIEEPRELWEALTEVRETQEQWSLVGVSKFLACEV